MSYGMSHHVLIGQILIFSNRSAVEEANRFAPAHSRIFKEVSGIFESMPLRHVVSIILDMKFR